MIVDKYFLFSVDLEDVRQGVLNGDKYKERVTINTKRYLDWLKLNNFKCTFFTTGQIAKDFPYLIEEVVNEGHEIACHTTNHIPLDKQTQKSFKLDLIENIQLLKDAGAKDIFGFRAPILSLVEKTKWAYDVLDDLGFRYSSSVLPAKNPLYGWEEFGTSMKIINNKILEIPISIGSFGNFSFPIAGGVYFRVLPFLLLQKKINQFNPTEPLVGYFHPYDIDSEQEQFMHGGINDSKFYNWLMYYNRKNLIKRLDKIILNDFKVTTYIDYISNVKKL